MFHAFSAHYTKNDHAERSVRNAVLRRKVSLGADSEEGCRFVERTLTWSVPPASYPRALHPQALRVLKSFPSQPRAEISITVDSMDTAPKMSHMVPVRPGRPSGHQVARAVPA